MTSDHDYDSNMWKHTPTYSLLNQANWTKCIFLLSSYLRIPSPFIYSLVDLHFHYQCWWVQMSHCIERQLHQQYSLKCRLPHWQGLSSCANNLGKSARNCSKLRYFSSCTFKCQSRSTWCISKEMNGFAYMVLISRNTLCWHHFQYLYQIIHSPNWTQYVFIA